MNEEVKKLENAVEYQKKFDKTYPNIWKMPSYYSWDDNNPIFRYEKGNISFEIRYNKQENSIDWCEIKINDAKNYEEFAQNPILFLQKQLFDTPILVNNDKNIIDFAQDTILKAIKGA